MITVRGHLLAIPNSVLDLAILALGISGIVDLLALLLQLVLRYQAIEAKRGADQSTGHEASCLWARLVRLEETDNTLGTLFALSRCLTQRTGFQERISILAKNC